MNAAECLVHIGPVRSAEQNTFYWAEDLQTCDTECNLE